MALEHYLDEQLLHVLHAGPLPRHLQDALTEADTVRLLCLVADDPFFTPAERQTARDLCVARRAERAGRGRVVKKSCPRCHAVSQGGVFCPNGCGRV